MGPDIAYKLCYSRLKITRYASIVFLTVRYASPEQEVDDVCNRIASLLTRNLCANIGDHRVSDFVQALDVALQPEDILNVYT